MVPVRPYFRQKTTSPICVVMNVSIEGGQSREGGGASARNGAGAEQRLTEPSPTGVVERCWNAGVETLAARWQAALGGFHHTGAASRR